MALLQKRSAVDRHLTNDYEAVGGVKRVWIFVRETVP